MRIEWKRHVQVRGVILATSFMRRVADPLDLRLSSEALPAKLMPTFLASHMVAAVRLLYAPSAAFAWASLGYRIDHGIGLCLLFSLLLSRSTILILLASLAFMPFNFVLETLAVIAAGADHEIAVLNV